jgi:hypothetical protein
MEGIERMRDAPAYGGKPPEQMSPQELHSVLWQVLSFRDSGTVAVLLPGAIFDLCCSGQED